MRIGSIWGIAISLLLAAGAGAQTTGPGAAGTPPDSTRVLQEILITDVRGGGTVASTARSVTRLSGTQLIMGPGQTPADLLEQLPGIDIRSRGPLGVQADLNIRGGNFNQSLVLMDGIRLGDPQTGHHLLNLPALPEEISGLEVLTGPASHIYGPGAFSGVVNLTSEADKQGGYATLVGGDYGLFDVRAGQQLKLGRTTHRLAAGYRGADGQLPNTDFENANLWYRVGVPLGQRQAFAWASYSNRQFGAQNYYFAGFQRENTEAILVGLGLLSRPRGFTPRLYWRRHFDHYIFSATNPTGNRTQTDVVGAEGDYTWLWNWGRLTAGADLRTEQMRSNALGTRGRGVVGLYLSQETRLLQNRLILSPAVHASYFSDFGWIGLPALGARYQFTDQWAARGHVGRSYRIPSYVDLYLVSSQNLGNPDLEPEDAWNYELGGEYAAADRRWNASVTGYIRAADALIDFAQPVSDATAPFTARNVLNLTARGLEASLTYRRTGSDVASAWPAELTVSGSYIDVSRSPDPAFLSRYVFDYLGEQLSVRSRWVLYHATGAHNRRQLELTPTLRYEGRASQQARWLLDARLALRFWWWEVYAEGSNLTNIIYSDFQYSNGTQLLLPGRWLRMGLSVRWP